MNELSLREVQLMQLDLMKLVDKFCLEHDIQYYLIAGSCLGAVRHGGFIPWDDDIDIAMMRGDYERFIELFNTKFPSKKYFLQNAQTDPYFSLSLSRICIRGTFVQIDSEKHFKVSKNTYIDVFPLDNVPDEESLRAKQMAKLKRIDRLISLKEYHLYRNKVFEKITKQFVSLCLSFIPISFLKKRRHLVMTAYDCVNTQCVCSTTSKYGYYKQIMDRTIYGRPVRICFENIEFNAPEKTNDYLNHLYGSNFMQIPPEDKRVKPHKVFKI